jgi:hypothetical protein
LYRGKVYTPPLDFLAPRSRNIITYQQFSQKKVSSLEEYEREVKESLIKWAAAFKFKKAELYGLHLHVIKGKRRKIKRH